jgi:hypothetical protein
MVFSHARLIALYHAKDACLRLLAERRTRGRMLLYIAVGDLLEAVR